MSDFWKMEIVVSDKVIRDYHDLASEDPETDQTLVSDWLSDLVIDAREADGENQYPEVAAAKQLRYGRAGGLYDGDANFVFVRATRLDNINATDVTAGADGDEAGSDED